MKKRGRTSAAEHEISALARVDIAAAKPEPPDDFRMSNEQVQIWWSVVGRLPGDWFQPENVPLLVQYCRHITRANRLARLIDAIERDATVDVEGYTALLRAEEVQSRAISSLATRLRLTQQAAFSQFKTKPATTIDRPKPWEGEI